MERPEVNVNAILDSTSPMVQVGSKRSRRGLRISVIAGLVAVIAVLVGVKANQISAMVRAGKSFVPPPESVTTAKVESTQWQASRAAVGSLVAIHGVTLGAELPGIIRKIGFESGTPVSVNGSKLGPVELLDSLNEIAAKHGIGRTDLVENRLVGMKSRGAYETPGGTLLVKAHQELERLTVDRETAHFQQALSNRYAELVYYGLWFSPLREALDGFFTVAQQRVTGAVGLKLWKGTLSVTKRVSPFSLYRADLASFTMGRYNPKDAEGFINLFALPVTVRPKAKAGTQS